MEITHGGKQKRWPYRCNLFAIRLDRDHRRVADIFRVCTAQFRDMETGGETFAEHAHHLALISYNYVTFGRSIANINYRRA